MAETVIATYEGGVLRPAAPLRLAEGTRVQVTLNVLAPRPDEDTDDARRRDAAAFVQSLIDLKDSEELPEGYDFLAALNANRSPGERPLFPPESKGITW